MFQRPKDWRSKMAAGKETVLDIDKFKIFNNPFEAFEPKEDCFELYEKYLSCKANNDILQKIGNNIITSSEHPGFGTTRDEILMKTACKNKIRTLPTIIHRDILNNTSGIIVQQVNCEGPMGGKIAKAISLRFLEVESIYRNLKVKTPGSIQVINLVEDTRHPLYLCNLFGEINSQKAEDWDKISKKKSFLKRGFVKLRVYMKKNNLKHLPIYIPYNMGEFQGWSWEDYEPVIMRYIPDAVICKL